MTREADPYPLLFQPILKAKVWGGDRLARLGKPVRPGDRIGESWEVADLDATSPSGGGGEPAHSLIRNGPLAGAPIRTALSLWGEALLGAASPAAGGGFPLLIKHLDAADNLSVQVHPSPAYAASHPGAHVKHEAWCVIEAHPGSLIHRGLKPGVTREDLRTHAERGTIAEALVAVAAQPGMLLPLPSGVIHALGAGVLVAEVQTPSDTTFRLSDWGRTGRALHLDEALASAFDVAGEPTAPLSSLPAPNRSRITTERFVIERTSLVATHTIALSRSESPVILMVLRGRGRLGSGGEATPLSAGDTAVIPAACSDAGLTADSAIEALIVSIPV